ncbi:MAG: hypothetical protein V1691_02440 [Chloroflexota bacterium]
MKLSKTSWIILVIGVIVVAFGSLGIAYSQMTKEQTQLQNDLDVAEKRLANLQLKDLTAQRDDLTVQVSHAASQGEAARNALRYSIESIDVTDSLFFIAHSSGVAITDMSSTGPRSDEVGGVEGFVLPLSVRAAGDVSDLINFVINLNSDFTTGIVKSAQITLPSVSDNATSDNTTAEALSIADIHLIVFTYRGD